jgi:hypothetical protein
VTDINAFVRPSQRKAQRDAGLARMRQQVKTGQLEIHWMCEEEKTAYRLPEPLDTSASVPPVCDATEREPNEVSRARASAREGYGGPASEREDRDQPSIPSRGVAWLAPIVEGYHVGHNALAAATFRIVRLTTRTRTVRPR